MSLITDTELAVLAVLRDGDYHQGGASLSNEIIAAGGRAGLLPMAMKRLRDMGLSINSTKGPNAVWWMDATGEEVQDAVTMIVRRFFSEAVSAARSASAVGGPGSRTARERFRTIIGMLALDMTPRGQEPPDVDELLRPQPMSQEVADWLAANP